MTTSGFHGCSGGTLLGVFTLSFDWNLPAVPFEDGGICGASDIGDPSFNSYISDIVATWTPATGPHAGTTYDVTYGESEFVIMDFSIQNGYAGAFSNSSGEWYTGTTAGIQIFDSSTHSPASHGIWALGGGAFLQPIGDILTGNCRGITTKTGTICDSINMGYIADPTYDHSEAKIDYTYMLDVCENYCKTDGEDCNVTVTPAASANGYFCP